MHHLAHYGSTFCSQDDWRLTVSIIYLRHAGRNLSSLPSIFVPASLTSRNRFKHTSRLVKEVPYKKHSSA